MEVPHVFVSEEPSEDAAAEELARHIHDMGVRRPFIVSSIHGAALTARLDGERPATRPPEGADQAWAAELGVAAQDAEADAIVAVGGGRCLDIGKLAATRSGLTIIAVPTQLSHDGICSPVAVVPNEQGRAESIGAVAPMAVFVSLATIAGAPQRTVAAGIGDLLANPLALRDWQLASDRGLEELDQRAWEMSAESYDLIAKDLKRGVVELAHDPNFVRRLADALILSGTAMIASGTSRPASGGEHEISHAIDHLYGSRGLHGAQVAFGSIISMALYGDDIEPFRVLLRGLDLPDTPDALGFTREDVVRVILEGPNTRPGRFTILEEANLDAAGAEHLIDKIWP